MNFFTEQPKLKKTWCRSFSGKFDFRFNRRRRVKEKMTVRERERGRERKNSRKPGYLSRRLKRRVVLG